MKSRSGASSCAPHREYIFTEIKNRLLTETARGMALINGGGMVALGGFLQAMWDKPNAEYFKHSVLVGIAWMAAGVVLASAQFFLRYKAFESAAKHWRWAHQVAVGLSLGCFVIGVWNAVSGGLWSIR
jgi:hypothetical protein